MSTTTNSLNNSSTIFTVDNIRLDGNTISSLDTNGSISLSPNGTGSLTITTTGTGELNVFGTAVAGTSQLTLQNTDNTNAASNAQLRIFTGGTSGGDPYLSISVFSAGAFQYGIDNSDSDSLKETSGGANTPSTGTLLRKMTSAGIQTLPLQPSFFAYVNADIANVTGAGTQYVIVANWTEVSDIGGNFSAGVFTAPVAGTYQFNATISLGNIGIATSVNFQFLYSQILYFTEMTLVATPASGRFGASGSLITPLAASEQISIRVQAQGAAGDTLTVKGGSAPYFTCFSGALIC